MNFNLITTKLHKYTQFFWILLFVSVVLGLGSGEVYVSVDGSVNTVYHIINLCMLVTMTISVLIHITELYTAKSFYGVIERFSVWCTTAALIILASRALWLLINTNLDVSIAPATVLGAFMISIGTAASSISRMYRGS